MKHSMKKLTAFLLAVICVCAMTGCGAKEDKTATTAANQETGSGETTAAGGDEGTTAAAAGDAGTAAAEEGKELRVAMECGYAPYNWTQPTDANGALPISGSSDFAYGYDVMMAKHIADKLG